MLYSWIVKAGMVRVWLAGNNKVLYKSTTLLNALVIRHALEPSKCRSSQPGHPSMCRHNEYQPKNGDALWLGSKGRYGLCVGGR